MRYIAVPYTNNDAYVLKIPTLATETPMPLYDIVIMALFDKINAAQNNGSQAAQASNSTKVETVTRKQCHSYAEQICDRRCTVCKEYY